MKTILMAVILLNLTACATPPQWLANYYNNNDPCQSRGQENYQYPSWCGVGSGRTYVTRDYNSGRYLTTTKAQ